MVATRPPRLAPSVPSDRPDWTRLLLAQHGVLSVEQLRRLGITKSELAANIDAHRWQHVLRGIYAVFTGPLPRQATLSAALLYGSGWAVLSHRTAAEEWGLLPAVDGPVHITVPYRCSALSQPPLVIVHRSRAFPHIAVDRDPPLTGRADTVIDLAVAEATPREAMRTATALLTGGRVSLLAFRERLRDRPPRRYRRALDDAARRVSCGVQSVLEEAYAVEVEQAHGLPAPHRQAPVVVDGRTLYEDVVYDGVGVRLTVRLDGRTHLLPDVAYRDRRRDNAGEVAGRARLSFGWTEISADPCRAAREVAVVLHRGGWAGVLRTCPRCS